MSTASQSSTFTPATFAAAQASEPARRRWTRAEYHFLGEQGLFQDQRVELIDGEIILLSPRSPQHAYGSEAIRRLLDRAFGDDYWVRFHGPLTHGEDSEPEPDICVVRGSLDHFARAHPTTSLLIVEVSQSSLQYDKRTKQHLYASMSVPEYWILDLIHRQLMVHRDPQLDDAVRFGHSYASVTVIGDAGSVSPLAKPEATLAVAAMLPPKQSPPENE